MKTVSGFGISLFLFLWLLYQFLRRCALKCSVCFLRNTRKISWIKPQNKWNYVILLQKENTHIQRFTLWTIIQIVRFLPIKRNIYTNCTGFDRLPIHFNFLDIPLRVWVYICVLRYRKKRGGPAHLWVYWSRNGCFCS